MMETLMVWSLAIGMTIALGSLLYATIEPQWGKSKK